MQYKYLISNNTSLLYIFAIGFFALKMGRMYAVNIIQLDKKYPRNWLEKISQNNYLNGND